MAPRRFILNAGRTTKQGQQINVGKDGDEYQAIVNTITMHPEVWKASGHADNFADPFAGCKDCNRYYRSDHVADAVKRSKWVQALEKLVEVYVDENADPGEPIQAGSGELAGEWRTFTDQDGDTAFGREEQDGTLLVYGSASRDDLLQLLDELTLAPVEPRSGG